MQNYFNKKLLSNNLGQTKINDKGAAAFHLTKASGSFETEADCARNFPARNFSKAWL